MAEQKADETETADPLLADLEVDYVNKYGDEPNASAVAADLEAAPNKKAFVRRRDVNGMTLLHYFGAQDVDNDFETAAIVDQILQIDPSLAQICDKDGWLALNHCGEHLMDCSDDWTTFEEGISCDPPIVYDEVEGIKYLLPAFPESVFAASLLDEMDCNVAYTTDLNDRDTFQGKEANLVGLLRLAFTSGFHHIPAPQEVLETGIRAPFHVICSYAYEPVFGAIFDLFYTPDKASLPDPALHNLPPLHIILKSPRLSHPLPSSSMKGGPMFGFQQMRHRNLSIPLQPIKTLVEAHPAALDMVDEKGDLPIHLAVPHNNLELLQYLIKQRPESMLALDGQNRTPLKLACELKCDLNIVYFLVKSCCPTDWNRGGRQPSLNDKNHPQPPIVAPIYNQRGKYEVDVTGTLTNAESTERVSWSVHVLSKHWYHDGSERHPLINISATTGKLTTDDVTRKPVRVRLTAENSVGWSSTEFEIVYYDDDDKKSTPS